MQLASADTTVLLSANAAILWLDSWFPRRTVNIPGKFESKITDDDRLCILVNIV